MRWAVVAAVWLAASGIARADSAWDQLTVQRTLDSKLIPKPAFAQVSAPKEGANSYQIGAAAKYAWSASAAMDIAPFLEYQRNTQADKEQDFFKAGLSIDWTLLDLSESPISPVALVEVNYAHDDIKGAEAAQVSALVTPLVRGKAKRPSHVYRPNVRTRIAGTELIYAPYVGVEHDQVVEASGDAPTGANTRVLARIDAAVYPATQWLDDRIELAVSFTYRQDVIDDIDEDDSSHPLLKTSINVYFVKDDKRSAGVGLDYERGEDPSRGFADQELIRAALKVKL